MRTSTPANGFDLPASWRHNSALGSKTPTFRVHVLLSSSSALRLAPVGRTIFHSDEALARHNPILYPKQRGLKSIPNSTPVTQTAIV